MAIQFYLEKLKDALTAVVTPAGRQNSQRIYVNPTQNLVTTAELPAVILLYRKEPITDFMTFAIVRQTHEVVIQFIYKPVGQGLVQDNIYECMEYREPILDALHARQQLYNNVNWMIPTRCGMPMVLKEKWAGQAFLGFDTTVTIVESRAVTIGQ